MTCNCMGPQNGEPLCPCQMAAGKQTRGTAQFKADAPDDLALLSLLADIRKAAGDAEGRLMQDELVASIAALRADAERWQWLRNRPYGGLQVLAWASEGNTLDIRHACDLDELIDTARAAK